MRKEERVKKILDLLDEHYEKVRCYLNYETTWQLLFATMLSAQCTAVRVNMVTAVMFKKYPNLSDYANISLAQLEKEIHSTGFYHNKAKNMIACAKILLEKYDGEVPSDIEELVKLPGVGRKTANVVRGEVFKIPSVIVDTHVGRLSRRLGLTKNEDPEKVEYDLMKILPKDHWILINFQLIAHGRAICTARSPKCGECFLKDFCKFNKTEK